MRRTIWSCALSCRVWVLCAYLFFFVQPSPPKDEGFVRSPIYCDPSQLPLLCSSIYDILDWIVILTSPSRRKVTYLNNDIHYEVISCYLLLERGTNASRHIRAGSRCCSQSYLQLPIEFPLYIQLWHRMSMHHAFFSPHHQQRHPLSPPPSLPSYLPPS